MALFFKDNSELTNFIEILNYYKNLFNDVLNLSDKSNNLNHGANPYLPDKWEVQEYSNYDDSINYIYNPGYNYLKGLINLIEATKNGIYKGLRTLFINYDDPEDFWQEDLNYNIINAYAEGSKSFKYYNQKTQEFEERPEYFWTRGNYYDMLPMCTDGKYLLSYKSTIENACLILEKYKNKFYTYRCSIISNDNEVGDTLLTYDIANSTYAITASSESLSNSQTNYMIYFYTSFWNEHLASLKDEIENSGNNSINSLLKIGQETQYPEQNNDTEVTYITKYYSNLLADNNSVYNNTEKVTNTFKISNKCGEYKNIFNWS